jgi:hypothetical protein
MTGAADSLLVSTAGLKNEEIVDIRLDLLEDEDDDEEDTSLEV